MDGPAIVAALEGRRLPAAYVDLAAFDANAATVEGFAGTTPVRVASKSVRCRALLERVLARPGWRGVLCASAAEAVWLAGHGLDDLVVAYPTWDPAALRDVADRTADGARITLMVDSDEHVTHLARVARQARIRLRVAIDLDCSIDLPGIRFGVYRSPVRTPEAAVALALRIADTPDLLLDGMMAYEAQIAGLDDANPAIRLLKRRAVRTVAERRHRTVTALAERGIDLRFVNAGGSGSLATSPRERVVTEVTAGSALYAPTLFDHYADVAFTPAAGFALEVVRVPTPQVVTCYAGGWVASGPAGRDRLPTPWWPEGARLLPTEGAGEVQTPVRLPDGVPARHGDRVLLRHAKAGELCEHAATLLLIEGDTVVDEVPTYRGEGLCLT